MNTQTQSKLEIIAIIIGIVANIATIVTFVLPYFTSIQTTDPNWSVPQTSNFTIETTTLIGSLKFISFFYTWFIFSWIRVRQISTSNNYITNSDFKNKIYRAVVGVGSAAFPIYCLLFGPLARKLWLDFNNLQPAQNETEKLLEQYMNPSPQADLMTFGFLFIIIYCIAGALITEALSGLLSPFYTNASSVMPPKDASIQA